VDKGAAENASEPYQMIVVMPDGGQFGWYANHVDNGPRWESFHIGELIPWVDATFRTKPQRSERAIAGLSMGGHGTAAYSGRHPDLFAAAEAFSGVVNPLALGPGENVFGPKTPENIARWEGSDGTYLIPNYRTYTHFGLRTRRRPARSLRRAHPARRHARGLAARPEHDHAQPAHRSGHPARVGGGPGHAYVAVLRAQPAPGAAGVPACLRR
jgi:hypothetical protein